MRNPHITWLDLIVIYYNLREHFSFSHSFVKANLRIYQLQSLVSLNKVVVSGFAFTAYVLLHQNPSIKLKTVGKDFISNLLDLYFCLELQLSLMFHGERMAMY